MRSFPSTCAATFLLSGLSFAGLSLARLPVDSAAAAEPQPTGEWLVANGLAHIRIDDCNGVLWGVIAWEKEPGGVDSNNPDPALRSRPTLGLPILLAMKPTKPGLWQGEVYNAENGKTYDSKISLGAPDVLRIEGCILGFLCGGENWTRIAAAPPTQRPQPAPPRTGKPKDAQAPLTACAGIPAGQK